MDVTELLLRIAATSVAASFALIAASRLKFKLRVASLELGRLGLIAVAASSLAVFASHILLERIDFFEQNPFLAAVVFGTVFATVAFLIRVDKSDVEKRGSE